MMVYFEALNTTAIQLLDWRKKLTLLATVTLLSGCNTIGQAMSDNKDDLFGDFVIAVGIVVLGMLLISAGAKTSKVSLICIRPVMALGR